MRLRVMTYNIRHGVGNDAVGGELSGNSSGLNLERTAAVIGSERPDVVAVQEVDRNWARSGCVDQAVALGRLLGMHECYGANLVTPQPAAERAEYGTAILSRYPIRRFDNSQLPVDEGWEPRGLLRAEIDTTAGRMVVLNTHLQVGFGDREADGARQRGNQALAVARAAAAGDVPVVAMGDFNAQPDDAELRPIFDRKTALSDAWRLGGVGAGFTIPAHPRREASKRIDLILVSRHWSIDAIRVVDSSDARMSSDHLPVVADLQLNG